MEYKILTAGILLVISLFSIRLSKKIQVPLLITFLIIGMLAGSEGIGKIYFDDAILTQNIGNFALLFILFSGALETKKSDAMSVLYPSGILATFGVFLTAILAGGFSYVLTDFSLKEALLFGAVVSSTDAAAVLLVLGDSNLKKKVKTLIEIESGSNDPMAYALILFVLSLFKADDTNIILSIFFLIKQIILGGLFGYLFGKITLPLGKFLRIEREEFLTILLISILFICFSFTNIVGGNGFLAIYLMGIIVGNEKFDFKVNSLRNMRVLSWLMQITMFILLGLLVFPSQLTKVVISGSILAMLIAVVARTGVIFLLLHKFSYTTREKIFISWAGLKGAVPIIFSTMAITEGIAKSQSIFVMVFYVVVFSVIIQGMTLKPLAKYFNLLEKDEKISNEVEVEELEELSIKKLYVDKNSEIVNKAIKDLKLPKNVTIISIKRDERDIIPRGDVIIKTGDKIFFNVV